MDHQSLGILNGSNYTFTHSHLIAAHSYQEIRIYNTNPETLDETQRNVLTTLKTKMDLRALQIENSGDQAKASEAYGGAVLLEEQILPWFWRECEHPGQSLLWLYENVVQRFLINILIRKLPKECLVGLYTSKATTAVDLEKALASNVAYGLIQRIPGLAFHVKRAIDRDPAVFEYAFAWQFEHLVVLPLKAHINAEARHGIQHYPGNTKLFIIDDLDNHLGFDILQEKLKAVTEALQKHKVPLVFFVASRRQPHANRNSWVSGLTKGFKDIVYSAVTDK